MTTDNGQPLATTVAAQHATIRALFAAVTDPSEDRRGERFADLARYLAIQDAAEHVFLQRTDTEQAAMVGRLEQLGPEDAYFLVQLGLLEEAVEEHAAYAEKNELPALEAGLAPEALEHARDGMAQVDVLFADRGAGAAVPATGGFQAQYEAARDTLRGRTPNPPADARSAE